MESSLNEISEVPEVDLSAVIADSKEQLSEPVPTKRGRGRPRKHPRSDGVEGSTVSKRPDTVAPPTPTPEIASLAVPLTRGLMAVSTIPASRIGIKELALTESEATPLAQSVDDLIKAYAPELNNISPKAAAWLSLGMVTGSLFISKMQVYNEIRQKQAAETRPEVSDTGSTGNGPGIGPTGPDESGGITIRAENHFRRK